MHTLLFLVLWAAAFLLTIHLVPRVVVEWIETGRWYSHER